ncbi:mitochondrial ATPase expression-domain-containing protein [Nemania sp. FL0916]|nr:mitochondrial ATPase expression-domain-containing protein [Nemania sp. FL0916]
MWSAVPAAKKRGYGALLQMAPNIRGIPSSISTLRLRRYSHLQKSSARGSAGGHWTTNSKGTGIYGIYGTSNSGVNGVNGVNGANGMNSLRFATTPPSPPPLSLDAVNHVQSLLLGLPDDAAVQSVAPAHLDTSSYEGVFGAPLSALREGDSMKLLSSLRTISALKPAQLQELATRLPRATFTEFFRALDPFRIGRDGDPIDEDHTPAGMFKMLQMSNAMEDGGVRRIYSRLLRRLIVLMRALQAAGYTLLNEEYICLFRCAGAVGEVSGVRAFWEDYVRGEHTAVAWRNSETYHEFIKARWLTEPLYTNYDKTSRMVTPRNLHRSRLSLGYKTLHKLDRLSLHVKSSKLKFGLDRAPPSQDSQEVMRRLRHNRSARRLFRNLTTSQSYHISENFWCALMIALGRSGTLRLIGTDILQHVFGIRTPDPFSDDPDGTWAMHPKFGDGPPRITPNAQLMRTVVEVYCSNGYIEVAVQLMEYISKTYDIPIPPDVWQDLLEWTYIMSSKPISTAWNMAKFRKRIPSSQAVEIIWNAMVSPPYNQTPTFRSYSTLIGSLVSRGTHDMAHVLPHMRKAILLYHEQCQAYEAAVFEYTEHKRDRVAPGLIRRRLDRARFKKQRMWYHISTWCRKVLGRVSRSRENPVPDAFIPAFIEEFRPFLMNPIEFATPTGRVTMVDPALETFWVREIGTISQSILIKNRIEKPKRWYRIHFHQRKLAVLSSHSLQQFEEASLTDPLTLLAPNKLAFKVQKPEKKKVDGAAERRRLPKGQRGQKGQKGQRRQRRSPKERSADARYGQPEAHSTDPDAVGSVLIKFGHS